MGRGLFFTASCWTPNLKAPSQPSSYKKLLLPTHPSKMEGPLWQEQLPAWAAIPCLSPSSSLSFHPEALVSSFSFTSDPKGLCPLSTKARMA